VLSRELRVESGVRAGNKVTPFYDPMIAKLCAWGPTRAEAIARLDALLAGAHIAPTVTNMPFVRRVLATGEFASGAYDTTFAEAFAKRKS
jgi:acetyl/propionyl-CoA carboxylase alpha subunit